MSEEDKELKPEPADRTADGRESEQPEGPSGQTEVIDGKATMTDAAAKRAVAKQQADSQQVTTSEPTDPPALEQSEQRQRRAEAAGRGPGARGAAARGDRAGGRAKPPADEAPKEPSPNQPKLDRLVELLKQHAGPEAIVEAYINEQDRHLPTLIIRSEDWPQCAVFLRDHEELDFRYLRNVSGVDQESHLEVVYHMISMQTLNSCAVKIRIDREQASIPSVTPVWSTANWNEREIYDLLGIDFPGHPDLRRIMMPDDWEGYPLRKDYVPYDPEV